jgi:hypothetical protein
MNQIDALLAQVGHYGGKVLPEFIARQARGLAGHSETLKSREALALESMKPQIMMMFLEDLGGMKKYTIEDIDDRPSGQILTVKSVTYRGKPALEFKLVNK